MTYAAGVFAICFVALYCFRFDRFFGGLTFSIYRAFGIASDRDGFVGAYRWFSRAVGAVMIIGIAVGLSLHASG